MCAKRAAVILICCIIAGMTATSVCAQDYHLTFALENTSCLFVDGVCYGQTLQSQWPSSGHAMLYGTIDTVVTFDGGGDPKSIKFVDANIVLRDWIDGPLAPAIGGGAGGDTADVGLSYASISLDLTLRDMNLDITSNQTILLSGSSLAQDDINYSISHGQLDMRGGCSGSSDILSGLPLTHAGSATGTLIEIRDKLEMVFPFITMLDISDITGVGGDHLRFNGIVHSSVLVPEPTGLSLFMLGGLSSIVLWRRRRS